ncbi:MAG: dihydrofolate reductase [Bifidobacteriaceae bacterium]|nr:dihydrofolate reductase [Bifidobacteriaceae bacterium]
MEHDSHSRTDHHEPKPGFSGHLSDHRNDDPFEDEEEYDEFDGDDEPKRTWVNLIWAQAHTPDGGEGIGFEGGIPWHLREDLKHFKALTVSHPVIMGRKTWESMGCKPLPNRDNIVISSDPGYRAPGASVVTTPDDALELASQAAIPDDGMDHSEIWIIGGYSVFTEMLSEADRAYVTQVDGTYKADTYAPHLDDDKWRVEDESPWMTPEQDTDIPRFRYTVYRKVEDDEDSDD